tara:strand:- start:80 stop:469 length:390 start_codon:yes stop_codon:yes gene_type:complete
MRDRLSMERESWVCMEGSWGATPRVKRTMKISAWVNTEKGRGGFEVYDVESGGEEYYGSGGIWLDNNNYICDYDGTGSLDLDIIEWLDELGLVDPDERCWFRKEITNTPLADRKTNKEYRESLDKKESE